MESAEKYAMRMLVGILLFSTFVNRGLGQELSSKPSESDAKVRIHRLSIEANNLPNDDRERITHLLEHCICLQGELQPRIRMAFRDLGYFKALVDEPKVSFVGQNQAPRDVDVSVKVNEGAQYHLGEIRIEKVALFPADQLRNLFPIQTGDVFNVTHFAEGLEKMRKLYATEGYVNFVGTPTPRIDESRHIIDLIIYVDEGKPFNFGRLFLDGTEPHTGAAEELMESWKTLQGKRYNPLLLNRWLAANTSNWPGGPVDADRIVDPIRDPESRVVNIKLKLP
jgi:outer membrane protein insertion porin family